MFHSRLFRGLFVLALMLLAAPAIARDWFVRAGSPSGDGSQAKPFSDPFEALATCEAGDVIHIAQGRYTGKLDSGEWIIPFDNISLLGGYNDDFSQRDPWKFHTMLVWLKDSKNSPTDERILSNAKATTIDGLVLDSSEQNEYDDTGRTPKSLDHAYATVRLSLPGTVKNCVFVNTGREAVICANGTTVENNLFMNTFASALVINGLPPAAAEAKTPAVVKNNTFLWTWDDRAPGTGHDEGNAIYLNGNGTITNNIFAFCDNQAIYSTKALDRSTIADNIFFMNLYANLKTFVDGQGVVVDDKTMDLLDEAGLKNAAGNAVQSPGMPLDPAWMAATTKRTASQPGKATMDDWNKVRQDLGMDLVGTGEKAASGIAPQYPLEKVFALMTPKDASLKAGARIIPLEVKFSGNVAAAPAKNYEKSDIAAWANNPESVEGKSLEMTVAISSVINITGIPDSYKIDDHEGIALHDPTGENRIIGFYKKGSAVNRFVNDNAGNYTGDGKPSQLFDVRGTAVVVKSVPKAGFYIESISPLAAAAQTHKKVQGRDWFVRAGASGGDGSREKPFRDPYQALEKCEAGDNIHVTTGDYVGKLHGGMWKVAMPDITMLGGYTKDFSARDPWKNPSLLYCPEDFKGSRGGYTLQGDADHSNFILDGFVFDKRFNNKYNNDGDLLNEESDHSPILWLSRPGCVIRNCVFMNGAEGSIRMTASQTLENNIIFNQYSWAVRVEAGFTPEVPAIIRNNTFAFAWEERFGAGHGLTGDLLTLETGVHAVVDNNVFEFADQQAIRLATDPKFVELTNNTFAHDLYAEVLQAKDEFFIDNKNFDKLSQLGWAKAENNQLASANLPLDKKWFDVYINRTAYVEGKVTMDDWNNLREVLGEPPIATGGKAGTGRAPAYDRAGALTLFPHNDKIKAGARPVPIEVKFEGVARVAETHDYTDVAWDDVQSAGNWEKFDGKRISMKAVIERVDNQYSLDDIKKEQFASWMITGPAGSDSPGLPMRVYVPIGTKAERAFNDAKGYSSGAVEETHIIKGIARTPRQIVVESVEKAD